MADGGNVEVVEIDGPIVKVRLQGACGGCPSSTMTLKMGVAEVVQVLLAPRGTTPFAFRLPPTAPPPCSTSASCATALS